MGCEGVSAYNTFDYSSDRIRALGRLEKGCDRRRQAVFTQGLNHPVLCEVVAELLSLSSIDTDLQRIEETFVDALEAVKLGFELQNRSLRRHLVKHALQDKGCSIGSGLRSLYRSGDRIGVFQRRDAARAGQEAVLREKHIRESRNQWEAIAIAIYGLAQELITVAEHLSEDSLGDVKCSCGVLCSPGEEGQVGPVIDATILPYRTGVLRAAGVLLLLADLAAKQLAGPWAREWRLHGKGEGGALGSLDPFISQIIREGFEVRDNGALVAEAESRRESFCLWVQEWSKACAYLSDERVVELQEIGKAMAHNDLSLDDSLRRLYDIVPATVDPDDELSIELVSLLWKEARYVVEPSEEDDGTELSELDLVLRFENWDSGGTPRVPTE